MEKLQDEIKRLMATGMTEEEARETALYDLEIENDKSEKKNLAFDLTAEQKKIAKKYTATGTKKTEYTFTKRERKPNQLKRDLIEVLVAGLEIANIKPVVTNIERQIDFECEGKQFSITLTEHRPKK